MAKSVKWLRQALKNLEQAYDYIAENNGDAAIGVVLKIQAATEQLAEFSMLGRVGRVEGTRELVIANTPYVVIYRVRGNAVEILRVFHTSKRYPD
ncbi:type II toxin-antitoxin system RelE/ParE family toxin [Phormidium sp. CLA17]|uniref:type II toxin-antitoxin system RelE/ParE family toxin n=1 Tax=Leptolyngbya sp. Cla-17 TaxID=2803751 RepID=UPI001490FD0A|nr:type II toxin-antitoxin system RelE/ParE family toxin [Leptolyngbya sp. Cla-17]MBM0744279.1 type II toxin-antitoxin system RelE/ParE family toxin [Leptolyngbya sp. Cla-17]